MQHMAMGCDARLWDGCTALCLMHQSLPHSLAWTRLSVPPRAEAHMVPGTRCSQQPQPKGRALCSRAPCSQALCSQAPAVALIGPSW